MNLSGPLGRRDSQLKPYGRAERAFWRRALVLGIALSVVFAGALAAVSGLTNGTFDTDVTGWGTWSRSSIIWLEAEGHDSPGAANVINGGERPLITGARQCINLESPLSQYTLSGWIKVPGQTNPGASATLGLNYWSDDYCGGTLVGDCDYPSWLETDTNWTIVSVSCAVPDSARSMRVFLGVLSDGSSDTFAYFDDISLAAMPFSYVLFLPVVYKQPNPTPTPTSTPTSTPTPSPTPDNNEPPLSETHIALQAWSFWPGKAGYAVVVMRGDGSDRVELTGEELTCWYPCLSPGLERVAAQCASSSAGMPIIWDIYVIPTEGGTSDRLTDSATNHWFPRWSPDGLRILYTSRTGSADYEVHLMDSDGSNPVQLTDNDANDFGSDWSPDGARILFSSDRDGNDYELYVMDRDGLNVTQLTYNDTNDRTAFWSPDGTRIAFMSDGDGDWEIFVMNADGSTITQLTYNQSVDKMPLWSPGGRYVMFTSDRDGDDEIYVMKSDGSDVQQLTHNDTNETAGDWR